MTAAGPTVSCRSCRPPPATGKRSSTYHAFLEGDGRADRPNLTVITDAQVTRVLLDDAGPVNGRTGVEYRTADGATAPVTRQQRGRAQRGRHRLAAHPAALGHRTAATSSKPPALPCQLDAPDVGKHLKDHLQVALVFPAPGVGVSMTELGISLGPDALRAPAGPLPADPGRRRATCPTELQALKQEAERRLAEWATTGRGLVSSSLYEACAWFSTGLGDHHTHDAQIGFFACGYNARPVARVLRVDPDEYFDDPAERLGARRRER